MTVLVKTSGDPAKLAPAILQTIRNADSEVAVGRIRTVEQDIAASLVRRQFALYLLAAFAILAAVLVTIGIYGVIGYSVSRRTHEFGIRMAVGARPIDLNALIVREAMVTALIGLATGALAAGAFTGVMKSMLYKLSSNDPVALIGVAAILLILALSAALIPALRAAHTDPAVALRGN